MNPYLLLLIGFLSGAVMTMAWIYYKSKRAADTGDFCADEG